MRYCRNSDKLFDGYKWKLEIIKENTTHSTGKKVKQIKKKTDKLIKIFNSVNEAARLLEKFFDATDIRRYCLDKNPSAYGYKWEFVN